MTSGCRSSPRCGQMARESKVTLVAGGMAEASDDPQRPYNTCAVFDQAGKLGRVLSQDPPVRRRSAGRHSAQGVRDHDAAEPSRWSSRSTASSSA